MRGPTPVQLAAPETIRVAVVDDDPFVRRSLVEFLSTVEDVDCVGHFAADADAVRHVTGMPTADVVILGIRRSQTGGLQAIEEILAIRPQTRVVIWTSGARDGLVERALAAGAAGFLVKDCSLSVLLGALRAAHLGVVVIAPEALSVLRGTPSPAPRRLSVREQDVLGLLCDGLGNAEIADALHISPSTVKVSVGSLMRKLGVATRVALVVKAFHEHLLADRLSQMS